MASRSKSPCRQAGCGLLLNEPGYCDKHRKAKQAHQDKERGTAHQRGYGYRWQQTSKGYIKSHPLCMCPACKAGELRVRVATVVDHIKPHKSDMTLFWDPNNWQAMHKDCHDVKTATEDGGFGRVGGGVKS